jgi:hypothetical protein
MKKSVIMVLALTALFGCSKMEQEVGVDVNGNPVGGVPVQLTGIVETVSTRGAGVISSGSGLEVSLYRADADASNTYSGYITTAIDGTLQSTGNITFDSGPQYWDGNGKKSSFIAVYPRSLTYNSGALTGTLDGSTDLMSSQLKEGDKSTGNTSVGLVLSHLLAKVEVKVKVEKDAAVTWGNSLTKIELLEQKRSVSLSLPTPVTSPSNLTVTPTFSDATGAFTLTTAGGGATSNQSLTSVVSAAVSYGYVMFAPASQKLKFKVTTSSQEYTIFVPKDANKNYEAGHGYTVTFTFTPKGPNDDPIGVEVTESTDSGIDSWQPDTDIPIGL